jgi:hypothetical protein
MEPQPEYIHPWTRKATGERRYTCRLCGGPDDDHGDESIFRLHLRTPFHVNKVRQMESLHCKVCDIRCKYPSHYRAHIKSKAHKHKEDPSTIPVFKCEACNMAFRCRAEEVRHLATAKHAKNVSKTDSSNSPPTESDPKTRCLAT